MQIVLNRNPIDEDTYFKCIITVFGNPVVLGFYKGYFFKSIVSVEGALKYPPAKINSKL